jgi:hypothetical protein
MTSNSFATWSKAKIFFSGILILVFALATSSLSQQPILAQPAKAGFDLKFTRPEFAAYLDSAKTDPLKDALTRFDRPIENNTFTITSLNRKEKFTIITVAATDLSKPKEDCEDSAFLCADVFNILLVNKNNNWTAALEYEGDRIPGLVSDISKSELSDEARKALFENKFKPSFLAYFRPVKANAAQLYNNYKLPWTNEVGMKVSQGWHGGSAIDFAHYGSSDSVKEKNILAAAPATVTYVCNGSLDQSVYDLSTTGLGQGNSEVLRYVHIKYSSIQSGFGSGSTVQQGDYLGTMLDGSNADDGCGSQSGPHVHLRFPSQDFVIDGVTFTPTNSHYDETVTSSNLSCPFQPPTSGTWNFTSKVCQIGGNKTAPGNIVVDNNSTLTIRPDGVINLNFTSHNLTVKNGSKIIVKNGGKIN